MTAMIANLVFEGKEEILSSRSFEGPVFEEHPKLLSLAGLSMSCPKQLDPGCHSSPLSEADLAGWRDTVFCDDEQRYNI